MNSLWSILLIWITATLPTKATEEEKLRKLGAAIFTTNGVVSEINLNRSKITNAELKMLTTFHNLKD